MPSVRLLRSTIIGLAVIACVKSAGLLASPLLIFRHAGDNSPPSANAPRGEDRGFFNNHQRSCLLGLPGESWDRACGRSPHCAQAPMICRRV
jgi:hypothetical protein